MCFFGCKDSLESNKLQIVNIHPVLAVVFYDFFQPYFIVATCSLNFRSRWQIEGVDPSQRCLSENVLALLCLVC